MKKKKEMNDFELFNFKIKSDYEWIFWLEKINNNLIFCRLYFKFKKKCFLREIILLKFGLI